MKIARSENPSPEAEQVGHDPAQPYEKINENVSDVSPDDNGSTLPAETPYDAVPIEEILAAEANNL